MTITPTIYEPSTLLATMRQVEAPTNFWLNLCFPNSMQFDDEWIDFSKITETRKLAPLVVPTARGVPMYSAAEKVYRVKPAYLKPKDPVSASHMLRKRAGLNNGELLNVGGLSPSARYDAIVADILRQHREGIERRWEWMAAEAALNGSITLSGENYPEAVVDFERDPAHTVTLALNDRWGDAGVSIIEDIETWIGLVENADFGGMVTLMIVGTQAWAKMRADAGIKDLMDNNYRQTSGTSFDFGPGNGRNIQFKGRVTPSLEVWLYNDYYHDESGNIVRFMDNRDVLLIAPEAVQGTRCFGAILDVGAGFQPTPIYPKMWNEMDPSATHIMSQSAPLMVPVNPNATLRARVVA